MRSFYDWHCHNVLKGQLSWYARFLLASIFSLLVGAASVGGDQNLWIILVAAVIPHLAVLAGIHMEWQDFTRCPYEVTTTPVWPSAPPPPQAPGPLIHTCMLKRGHKGDHKLTKPSKYDEWGDLP